MCFLDLFYSKQIYVCATFYNCQPVITPPKKNRSANKIDMCSFNVIYIYIIYIYVSVLAFVLLLTSHHMSPENSMISG